MPNPQFILKEPTKIDEYHLLEIQEIFERIRAYSSLRVTVATFFGTINLSIMGFAFNLHNATLFFFAAASLFLWFVADTYARRELLPFYYRGLQLEKKYAPEGEEALLHTYIEAVKSRRDLKIWLGDIAKLENHADRVNQLRSIKFNFGGMWWALILIFFVELGLGVALYFFGGWH
jgi:hypothetical protein